MANWAEESIITVGVGHVIGAEESVRREFVENYKRSLFPALGTTTGQTIWKTYRNITRVTLWGREHFCNNVRVFSVMKALDLGPDYYCVERGTNRAFNDRLFLLTRFLPDSKICLYATFGLPLKGPFERSAHAKQIGEAIANRKIPQDCFPSVCPACHSHFCDHAMEGLSEV